MSSGSGEPLHLVDVIFHDHKEIRAFFEQYTKCSSEMDKQKWSNQWRWEVARHAVSEELVAYPALEYHVVGGLSLAEKDRAQHQVVKQNISKLEGMAVSDASYDPLMHETQRALEEHMKEEEENDLVKLRDALPRDEGLRLGSRFSLTKKFVPTHAHPSAPNKPPFETIVGLFAAPLDKLMDMIDNFPSSEEVEAAIPN